METENIGYQCGQLLKLADVIGQRYGDSIPGSQTYEQISRYPRRGLENLFGRTNYYVRAARRAGDDAAVLWDKLLDDMVTIDDGYRWTEEEKALLFVGYLAPCPSSARREAEK